MLLPEGVNPIHFFDQAKSKGIKITSRFNGVSIKIKNKKWPCWQARYQKKDAYKFIGLFDFSISGELEARKAYLDYLQLIGEEERYTIKRKIKKSKS
jgi:hypothetical protein